MPTPTQYLALREMLKDGGRLFPEEREEIEALLAEAAVRIPACVCAPARGVQCVLHAEESSRIHRDNAGNGDW